MVASYFEYLGNGGTGIGDGNQVDSLKTFVAFGILELLT